jgi:hypothetical protein
LPNDGRWAGRRDTLRSIPSTASALYDARVIHNGARSRHMILRCTLSNSFAAMQQFCAEFVGAKWLIRRWNPAR